MTQLGLLKTHLIAFCTLHFILPLVLALSCLIANYCMIQSVGMDKLKCQFAKIYCSVID